MGTHVLWTDKKSLLRDMLKALKNGESVGFVMDQKPEGRQGPLVTFLGVPTEFVSGPGQMTAKTGCGVVSIFCLREGPFKYRILSEMLAAPGVAMADEAVLTQRMADAITRVVRLYPEQWTWNYKRWRDDQRLGGVQPPIASSST
jgi:KDO2-lipid IV(A) lauroyltransferase